MKIPEKSLIVYKKNFRIITPNKYFIDKSTPVGDPAIIYERMPYNGYRDITSLIIGRIYGGKFCIENCRMTKQRYDLIKKCVKKYDLLIDETDLFHNHAVYTVWSDPFKKLTNDI